MNLVQSETTLNAGATTASGFGVVQQATQPVFGARLGFLGVDFGKFGRLTFGKQNSTHYDIASYTTDRFNVFGGQSTATYVAGTDGGQSGTGRADQTILYHLKFAKIFDFGAQGQLRTADTPQAFNGFGFSLQAAGASGSENRSEPITRPTSTRRYGDGTPWRHRITGPLEAKAIGATLNGAPTGCGRPTVTSHSSRSRRRPGDCRSWIFRERSRDLFQTEVRKVRRRPRL